MVQLPKLEDLREVHWKSQRVFSRGKKGTWRKGVPRSKRKRGPLIGRVEGGRKTEGGRKEEVQKGGLTILAWHA